MTCSMGRASGVGRGGRCPLGIRHRSAGENLYLEGQPAASVWYIKSGTVALLRDLPGGEGVRAIRREGSLVGIEAVTCATYLDTARALTDLSVCGLSRAGLDNWLGPAAPARALLEQTVRDLVLDAPRGAGPDGSATRRVARWILDAGTAPAVPRRMVASMLGMVPETLSRALAELRRCGAIETTRRTITVRDRDRLLRAGAGES
jgi:CRP-like cAMP-binding protein